MQGLIHSFAAHRIAPNLLMLLMLLSGVFVFDKIETRFFPQFEVQVINVRVNWRNASAEDVVTAVLTPLENELRNVSDWETVASYARDGYGVVYLEFPDRTDINEAADEVRRHVDFVAGKLPGDSEPPKVETVSRHDEVMRLALTGNALPELRRLARRLENELLRLGVVEVDINGLPPDEIRIQLGSRRLRELGLTPRAVGRQIAAQNVDISAGDVAGSRADRQLRLLAQGEQLSDFARLQIIDRSGEIVRLGDIAELTRAPERDNTAIFFNGKPAVEFILKQKSGGSALAAARVVNDWRAGAEAQLPPGITLTPHRERWQAIESRMQLLIDNGLQGLVLVLLMLMLFLNMRLALWIAAGIPATFMVALCALYWLGGSLNMISMFAFIMVTGIVVDDAIVVGENGYYHFTRGDSPLTAAVRGAKEMFAAVFSSTFTTISAFLPLLVVGGATGAIMLAIPIVVVCVLLASFVECFLVLPGHMRSAFSRLPRPPAAGGAGGGGLRQRLDSGFARFEQGIFRRSVMLAVSYRWVTVVLAFTLLTLSIALIMGGLLGFRFFPGAELNRVQAQVAFVAGTPRAQVEQFMWRLDQSLRDTAASFTEEKNLLRFSSIYMGQGSRRQGNGDEKARLIAQLVEPDERTIGTAEFVRAWRKRLPQQAGLESLLLREARGGPRGGDDLEVRLSGNDLDDLKAAARELKAALLAADGVSRPADDLPYGKNQTIFELTPLGRALDLSVEDITAQLRDVYNGFLVQTLYEGIDEIAVRVLVHDTADASSADFSTVDIQLPNGNFAALSEIVRLSSRTGFETIQRDNTQMIVNVSGNIDFAVTDVARAQRQLEEQVLPALVSRYGVTYSFEGDSSNQRQTVADMKTGGLMAMLSIYIILAAVFASWSLPLVILLTVPFGIIGAFIGHWLLGYDMSILSAFGIFALSGIIVNDSIILIRDYLARLRRQPDACRDELIADAVCRRLRAILLTSLTTIGGLIPLMFETSIQAQFLIPMAISICFGLAFATLLILYLTPAYLSIHNALGDFFAAVLGRRSALPPARAAGPIS